MKKYLVFLLAPLLYSCSTDFDTIAEYKEITVVYGLLNQYDSTEQLVRINKAYLGEGNALIMAQVQDSINYSDSLQVTMEKIDNGVVTATYTLNRYTGIPKDSGLFNYPYQDFYRYSGPPLNINSQYKLKVRHTETGNEVTAITSMLGNCLVDEPDPVDRFNFTSPVYPVVLLVPAPGAKIYNVSLRFHYTETENGTGIKTGKYFDWHFDDQVVDPATVNEIRQPIPSPDFYFMMGQKIPVDTHVTRQVGDTSMGGGLPIEIIVTAGSEDLYRYMELTAPSNTIVQERPVYSNITNGTGLFTSRLSFSAYRLMSAASIAAIDTSQYTFNLGF